MYKGSFFDQKTTINMQIVRQYLIGVEILEFKIVKDEKKEFAIFFAQHTLGINNSNLSYENCLDVLTKKFVNLSYSQIELIFSRNDIEQCLKNKNKELKGDLTKFAESIKKNLNLSGPILDKPYLWCRSKM